MTWMSARLEFISHGPSLPPKHLNLSYGASLSLCASKYSGAWSVPHGLPFPTSPTDFFEGKHFFLYGEFPGDERRKLIRYVTAYNGWVVGLGGHDRGCGCGSMASVPSGMRSVAAASSTALLPAHSACHPAGPFPYRSRGAALGIAGLAVKAAEWKAQVLQAAEGRQGGTSLG